MRAPQAVQAQGPLALRRAEARVRHDFEIAGVAYPPAEIALVALKREARLEVWADGGSGWSFVRSYLIRSGSGALGPKLKEGDHQVPEGLYRIVGLNPKSSYYLSLRLDYPNDFDRAKGRSDGRIRLGGDIMIHGGRASEGCLPVGDEAVEDLFVLASAVDSGRASVVIAPLDLRRTGIDAALSSVAAPPRWLRELYVSLASALTAFPVAQQREPSVPPSRLAAKDAKCRAHDHADCARDCANGDIASCARMGVMARDGYGKATNVKVAWTYLGRACAGGDALGCAELARLHLEDDGERRDAWTAAALAQAACAAGEGHGCIYLANLCVDRLTYLPASEMCSADAVNGLRARAVELLASDCRGWGAYDCLALAGVYANGDYETATRFAAGACRGGEPDGCYELARLSRDDDAAASLDVDVPLYTDGARSSHASRITTKRSGRD